jgi:SEC-C motif-containing protein
LWHQQYQQTGTLGAPDALALMRSRYSAYVLELPDYLLATWHPSTRPAALHPLPSGATWVGLAVQAHNPNSPTQATVSFIARSREGHSIRRMQEISQFVQELGQWYYVAGKDPRPPGKQVAS